MKSVYTLVLKLQWIGKEVVTVYRCSWNIKSVLSTKGQTVSPALPLLLTLLLQLLGVNCHNCEVVVMFSLKTAQCNDRNFQSVPRDLGRDIKVLSFEGNGLTYLGMDYFKEYPALQEIYFSNNRIDSIAPDAFRGLRNLQILDISGNKLTSFPTEVFKHLRYVREVNFKGNPIKYILEDDLQFLPNLEIISFENNWLERIHPKAFAGLEKLEEINLVNNELTFLSSEMETELPRSLKFFRLYQNPWNCDCKLRWLRQWIASTKVNWDFGTTIPNTPACSTPEILRGINWKHLEPDKFACGSKILTNGSATIEMQIGQNITIDCNIVSGDPVPSVFWMKGQKDIPSDSSRYSVLTIAQPDIRSSLTIWKVNLSDQGDYKCVAKNPVGESEVTFKLWFRGTDTEEVENYDLILGIRKEVVLGIAVGLAVLILILVICCVYGFRKRNRRNHAYKVRDYKKPVKKDKKIKNKHCDMKGEKSHPNVTTELLGDKKLEQKEIMLKEINEKQNEDFKMKIFSYHDPSGHGGSQSEHSLITVGEKETDPLCDKKLKGVSDDSRQATPDLLRNDYSKSDSDKPSQCMRDDNSGDEGYRSLNGSGTTCKEDKQNPKQAGLSTSTASSQSAKSEKSKSEKRVDFADGVTSIDDVLTSTVVSSLTSSPTRSKKDNSIDSTTLPSAMKQVNLSKQTSLESATMGRASNQRQSSVDSSISRDSGLSDRYAPLPSRQSGRNPYISHTVPRQQPGSSSRQSSVSSSPSLQRTPHKIPSKQSSVTSASSSGSTSPTRAQLQHLLRSYQSSPTRVGKGGPGGGSPHNPDLYQNVPALIKINTKDIPQTYTTKDGRTLVIPPPPPPPQIATRTLGRRLPIPPPPAPPQAGGPHRLLSPQPPKKPPRVFSSLYDFQTAGSSMSDTDEVPEPMPQVGEKTEFGTCV